MTRRITLRRERELGNRFTGNKDSGYTLTVPGLDQAAALIKTAASGDQAAG